MLRITRCESSLVPLPTGPHVLRVTVSTDGGPDGLGFALLPRGGRAALAVVADDIAPRVVGADALQLGPLWHRIAPTLAGLGMPALSAVDLALWDIKGKVASLPVCRLLPGGSSEVLTFVAGPDHAGASPDETLAALRPARERGVRGVELTASGEAAEDDVHRLERIRDQLGDQTWVAVRAVTPYDLRTALSVTRYAEEEVGVDWFEGFIAADDVDGHARLASHLEVPIAVGGTFADAGTFRRFVDARAAGVLRPDPQRLGGLTPLLLVAAFAELTHRALVPIVPPQIGAHLGCGVPGVHSVPYTDVLTPLFGAVPLANGFLRPPTKPGWGWE